MSPLGHHTFDSTHIAFGVLTGGVERGPVQVESSIFHGAEPDENRWDLMDPGALDSWSVRGWYRPSPEWTLQGSHGLLHADGSVDTAALAALGTSISRQMLASGEITVRP